MEDETELKILGDDIVAKRAKLITIPQWAQKATTFSADIGETTGNGISRINGLNKRLHKSLSKTISKWFPVQEATLPTLLRPITLLPPRDVVISAPTGSGKTLCYVLPILNYVYRQAQSSSASKLHETPHVKALVLAPTRTLVQQIGAQFRLLNVHNARIVVLNESDTYANERKQLFTSDTPQSSANIIISTPLRIVEHLIDDSDGQREIDLSRLRFLVVDEADSMSMVRESWLALIEKRANCPSMQRLTYSNVVDERKNTRIQKILLSATLSLEADKLHAWNLRAPQLYRANALMCAQEAPQTAENGACDEKQAAAVATSNGDVNQQNLTLPATLKHEVKICTLELKPLFVYSYLCQQPSWRRVLVFANKTDDSHRLSILLTHLLGSNRYVCELTANLFGHRRLKALKRLKNAKDYVAVCSDTIGRGIDMEVDAVFNFSVPFNAQTFVHRAGRTARAGKIGHVVTLATKNEKMKLKRHLIGVKLWRSATENRENESEFVEAHRERYVEALQALKSALKDC